LLVLFTDLFSSIAAEVSDTIGQVNVDLEQIIPGLLARPMDETERHKYRDILASRLINLLILRISDLQQQQLHC